MACEAGNSEIASALMDAGAGVDLNIFSYKSYTYVRKAYFKTLFDYSLIKLPYTFYVKSTFADVDDKNEAEETPLHMAVKVGHLE
jgi:hypothetical protein